MAQHLSMQCLRNLTISETNKTKIDENKIHIHESARNSMFTANHNTQQAKVSLVGFQANPIWPHP